VSDSKTLKRINVDQVRVGMFLHSLDGAWMDHPFWRSRFVISSDGDLRKLQTSRLDGVWIDTAKGLDVATRVEECPEVMSQRVALGSPMIRAEAFTTASSVASPPAPMPVPAPSTDFQQELAAAQAIYRKGREQLQSMFGQARLGKAVDAEACMPLVNDITESVFRNPGALVSLARLKTQDDYTYMHSVAVCALMVALGREVGLDADACRAAGFAGLLHDMGKAAMPLDVLNKPGKLTDEEFAVMKSHPERGHEMLLESGQVTEDALDVCLHHHEKVDGSGYPQRLQGDQISLLARMGAVCDVYDAITSDRPYKAGWDPAESIAKMASWKGHFDPAIFKSFVKSLGIYPTGSLVRLKSNKLAVVVEQNPTNLISPVVKVFFSIASQMPLVPQRVDLSRSQDAIIGRESPEQWGFKQLDELWAGDAAPRRG